MDIVELLIDFLTDPQRLGFPLLIISGLGAILYLMNYSSKEWKRQDTKKQQQSSRDKSYYKDKYPFKPF